MLRNTHKKTILSLLSVVTLSMTMSCSKCGMGTDASKAADTNKSTEVTKSDYIAKVDAICTKNREKAKTEMAALQATLKPDANGVEQTRFGAKLFDRGIDFMEEVLKEIEAVPMPTEGADDFKKFYADLHQMAASGREQSKIMTSIADAMDKAADPAKAEEASKEIEGLNEQMNALGLKAKQNALSDAAAKVGFKVCGQH